MHSNSTQMNVIIVENRFKISYPSVIKELYPSSVKKVHRAGSQPSHYPKMVSCALHFKGPSEMPFCLRYGLTVSGHNFTDEDANELSKLAKILMHRN